MNFVRNAMEECLRAKSLPKTMEAYTKRCHELNHGLRLGIRHAKLSEEVS